MTKEKLDEFLQRQKEISDMAVEKAKQRVREEYEKQQQRQKEQLKNRQKARMLAAKVAEKVNERRASECNSAKSNTIHESLQINNNNNDNYNINNNNDSMNIFGVISNVSFFSFFLFLR